MDTVYVKLTGYFRRTDTRSNVEWRIQDSESWPGKLEIAVYGWNSGDELSVATLEPHEVVMLLAALETNTAATVNVYRFSTRSFHDWAKRWYENDLQGVTMRTKRIPDREIKVNGEMVAKPSGIAVFVEAEKYPVEELTLRPERLAATIEALKGWLATVVPA